MSRRTIQHRLVAALFGWGAVASLALAAAILTYDRATVREQLLDRLEVQAAAIGEGCTAALEFGFARDAIDALGALRAATDVRQGALYTRDGQLLAAYEAPGAARRPIPAHVPGLRRSIADDGAVVVQPVLLRGERVGTIYLRASTEEVGARLGQYAAFLATVFVSVGLALGALLLWRLQRTIGGPLRDLAGVAADVRATANYAQRAQVKGDDEIGILAAALNEMLAAIQQRDGALERHRLTLEQTVATRTEELAATNARLEEELARHELLREHLAQSQKLEAIGRLAGGVAHDFNNLLAVILADARALEDDVSDAERRELAGEIVQAGGRAATLTRQLLAFSRKQVLSPRPVDVGATVGELSRMLGRLLGEDVTLVVEVHPGGHHVYMDPTQLEQALVNLAVNARDAMSSGGTLHVAVSSVRLEDAAAVRLRLAPARYVRITVSDTGAGMPPEVMARIFEPFFTTKPVGSGTGLGLAMVYGAVEQSGGRVDVRSAVGKGTTFTLFLPFLAGETLDVAPEQRAVPPPAGRGETVLVVEDEAEVRSVVRRMLGGAGYRVVEVSSGDEALARVRRQPVDLVLTDVVMPGLGGLALGAALERDGAAAPVLYMSGYSEEMLSARGAPPPDRLLAKPFTRDDLLARVRALLDERARADAAPRARAARA